MKLSVQHLGALIGKTGARVEVLEAENQSLRDDVNQLKEIVLNTLMKNNPDFKRNSVLRDMDDFLRKKIGGTRKQGSSIQN